MPKGTSIANTDFIPMALFELGGAGKFIDVENIFYRCYEISPERFGWRRYSYPNYKILYKALVDFEDKYPTLIIKTPDGLSRQLTAEGVDWINQRIQKMRKFLSTPETVPPSRRPHQRILNDIADHPLFREYSKGGNPEPDKYTVSDLLLCSPDSSPELWRERIETYKSAAEDSKRTDIVNFLKYLLEEKPEWFGGG